MMEWIKVSDRVPDVEEPVWVYWKGKEVVIGWKTAYDCEPSECWYSHHGGQKCRNSDWWMPIDLNTRPNPPEE